MIINLTDVEALALSQRLQAKATTIGDTLTVGEGLVDSFGEASANLGAVVVNVEALESAMAKLQAAMQKADAKLGRSLDYAIASLEGSGFDIDQLEALRGAKDKAALHNESKYGAKDVDAKFKQKG
tara:strand:- start:130 stop:507 length:378 start_codon:yes stop_codon:yes gene_type:complete